MELRALLDSITNADLVQGSGRYFEFYPKVKMLQSKELGINWRGQITLADGTEQEVVVLRDADTVASASLRRGGSAGDAWRPVTEGSARVSSFPWRARRTDRNGAGLQRATGRGGYHKGKGGGNYGCSNAVLDSRRTCRDSGRSRRFIVDTHMPECENVNAKKCSKPCRYISGGSMSGVSS